MTKNSLCGLRILNTRPKTQASLLSKALRDAGAISIELPMLIIEPITPTYSDHCPPLSAFHHAVFISPNAVLHFFNSQPNISWPSSINTLAIGPGTAQALSDHAITVHHQPSLSNSEHLLELECLQRINQQRILIIKGKSGRPLLEQTLTQRGAFVWCCEVYRRALPSYNKNDLDALWKNNAIDMILITSQEAMQHLFALFGVAAKEWLCSKPFLVLSPRLATIAAEHGVKTIITTEPYDLMTTLRRTVNES